MNDANAEEVTCSRCQRSFSSKTCLFQHLRTLESTCLSFDEHALLIQMDLQRDLLKAKNTKTLEKVAILYGYIALSGDDASKWVVEAVYHIAKFGRLATTSKLELKQVNHITTTSMVHRRSYGCVQRHGLFAQETGCAGAITEVLSIRTPPLPSDMTLDQWTSDINQILQTLVSNGKIQVFGRLTVHPRFDAEENPTHRRFEYILPVDFLLDDGMLEITKNEDEDTFPFSPGIQPPKYLYQSSSPSSSPASQLQDELNIFFSLFPSFSPTRPLLFMEDYYADIQTPTQQSNDYDSHTNKDVMVKYFYQLKKLMQSMTTESASSTETLYDPDNFTFYEIIHDKDDIDMDQINQSNLFQIQNSKHIKSSTSSTAKYNQILASSSMSNLVTASKKKNVKRHYHNFTFHGMAHENIVHRRMDRFYHRSTIRASDLNSSTVSVSVAMDNHPSKYNMRNRRPFIVFSLKGDSLLTGQIRGMIGLYVAIVRGYISKDIIECMLDPEYCNLVVAPFIPSIGMIAGEAIYSTWEGKMNLVLNPRVCNQYKAGWNDPVMLEKIHKFQDELYSYAIDSWYSRGIQPDNGRLKWETEWIRDHLIPWSKRAQQQLKEYQHWKQTKIEQAKTVKNDWTIDQVNRFPVPALLPPLHSIDMKTPALYEAVLYHLRKVNASGSWPTTTAKRQLVMVSTDAAGNPTSSIVEARIRASSNQITQSSAYSFHEGQGGASGSFTVGMMPGDRCEQPKSNSSFPELMKAAFELEIALCPSREPSSTIAINRNAQFRPHVDVGAGTGQSRSLIVGLGDYVGGELMVEGMSHDIRYKPLEFNGWKQRHWTLPFYGERYSLVFFTPKGCDGIHGIDLCT